MTGLADGAGMQVGDVTYRRDARLGEWVRVPPEDIQEPTSPPSVRADAPCVNAPSSSASRSARGSRRG